MLIDQAINETEQIARCDKMNETLKEAEVFVIDNVAKYYWEESNQESWDFERDFPNVAPPYENMWFEFASPKFSNNNGKIVKFDDFNIRKMGVYIYSRKVEDILDPPKIIIDLKCKWVSETYAGFIDINNKILIPNYCFTYFVGDNGEAIFPLRDEKTNEGLFVWSMPKEFHDFPREKQLATFGMAVENTKPCWLALSFLHCKNVEMHNIEIPAALQQARTRRGKRPLMSYHLLDVKPMTKVISSIARVNKTDVKKALHICRGHFKDYSKGNGLGRTHAKGLFWWDSFIRGSKDSGMVLKDYNVSPSEL